MVNVLVTLALVTICIILFVIAIYLRLTKHYDYWAKRRVPNRRPVFPFGSTKDLILAKTYIGQGYDKMYKEFVKERYFGIIDGMNPVLIVKDPDLIKSILVTDFNNFAVRVNSNASSQEFILKHVINMKGEEWKEMRALLSPAFTSGKMKSLYPLMQKCGEQLKTCLLTTIKQNPFVEVTDIFARFTMDIIASSAFGIETDSINNSKCEFFSTVGALLRTSKTRFFKRFLVSFFPFLVKSFQLQLIPQEVAALLKNTIFQSVNCRKENQLKRNDFLDSLMNCRKYKNKTSKDTELSLEEMTAQAFVFFIAGYTTDTSILSFCIYELARHPKIQDEVYENIKSVMKRHNSKYITFDDLQEIKSLDLVIHEALRLYGSGQIITRTCTKQYQIPHSDLKLETGIRVVIPTYSLHHDPQYFPDPYEFKPKRFLPEEINKRHPFVYLPFGEGPRNCIGRNFGMLQIKTGIATIIQHFQLELDPRQKHPIQIDKRNIVVTPANPLFIKFSQRNKLS